LDPEKKKRILLKLDEMIRYVEELKKMLPNREEYFNDLIRRRACEKTIQIAIDALIDVASMVVSFENFGLPTNEGNIFDILAKKEILNLDFISTLKDMKGFRNIMIHRYAEVEDKIVYSHLKESLDDFYEFKKQIQTFLNDLEKDEKSE
jgi:uncharacterized protein YutE (UPF0331/DUF86 family)